jgi:hypothetical protein
MADVATNTARTTGPAPSVGCDKGSPLPRRTSEPAARVRLRHNASIYGLV